MTTQEQKLDKKAVLARIKDMPERFSVDELLEHIVVMQKVERGMRELKEGKAVNAAKARKRLAKWLK